MGIQVPHEKGQAREKGSLIVKYRDIVKYRFSRFCTAGSGINSPEVVTRMRETARGAELREAQDET